MASPIAFSITWAQLDILRALPEQLPIPGPPCAALIRKGLAEQVGLSIFPTPHGEALRTALSGLARPKPRY